MLSNFRIPNGVKYGAGLSLLLTEKCYMLQNLRWNKSMPLTDGMVAVSSRGASSTLFTFFRQAEEPTLSRPLSLVSHQWRRAWR